MSLPEPYALLAAGTANDPNAAKLMDLRSGVDEGLAGRSYDGV